MLLSQLPVVAGSHSILLCVDTSPQFLPPHSNHPLLCVSLSISYKDRLAQFQSPRPRPRLIQYDFILISTLITSLFSFIYQKKFFDVFVWLYQVFAAHCELLVTACGIQFHDQ